MKWLRAHTFQVHLVAFLLMVLPPIPLYRAALNGNTGVMVLLLGAVILGNILVLFAR
jgi:hypothetical protein